MSENYSESMEMYLETMLDIEQLRGDIHLVEIARRLEISKPSVSRALKKLKSKELIEQEPYRAIKLTIKGREAALSIKNRHTHIMGYLIKSLGISEDTAEKDACRMEHILSEETLQAMMNYLKS